MMARTSNRSVSGDMENLDRDIYVVITVVVQSPYGVVPLPPPPPPPPPPPAQLTPVPQPGAAALQPSPPSTLRGRGQERRIWLLPMPQGPLSQPQATIVSASSLRV